MASDGVIVFNTHESPGSRLVTSSTGKGTRIQTTVTSEPLIAMLDEGAVAKLAAEALAKAIREQTLAITEPVKASTAKARRVLERAFSQGKAYAVKRFVGGKMGATPPVAGSDRMFNHSGRLARSIVANFSKQSKEWFIRYAGNRWNVADFSSPAAMQRAFQQWVARVPVLQDASSDLGVQRAIRETAAGLIDKAAMGTSHRTAMLKGRAVLEQFQKAASLLSDTTMTRDEEGAA